MTSVFFVHVEERPDVSLARELECTFRDSSVTRTDVLRECDSHGPKLSPSAVTGRFFVDVPTVATCKIVLEPYFHHIVGVHGFALDFFGTEYVPKKR
jgi:hypothetical protein